MNCEFQSMQIAQQKLSVTRDLQKAAQDYQNSLSATKLVWQTEDGDPYDLSYDIMMTPSVLNDFDAYLVTDQQGKIILNNKMWKAAIKAGILDKDGNSLLGIPDESGNIPDYNMESRDKFLNELVKRGLLNGADYAAIQALGDKGYVKTGVGGAFFDKTSANAMPTAAFINYMKTTTYDDVEKYDNITTLKTTDSAPFNIFVLGDIKKADGSENAYNAGQVISSGDSPTVDINYIPYNVKKGSPMPVAYKGPNPEGGNDLDLAKGVEAPCDLSFGVTTSESVHNGKDLIYGVDFTSLFNDTEPKISTKPNLENNTYIISENSQKLSEDKLKNLSIGDILTSQFDLTGNADGTTTDFKKTAEAVLEAIAKKLGLGAGAGECVGLNVDAESSFALEQAFELTKMQLNKEVSSKKSNSWQLAEQSHDTNCIVKNGNNYAVSLTNLTKSFLTNFAIALDGYNSDFNIDNESTKKSKYVTNDYTYYFLINNDNALTEKDVLMADFYNQLFNQLLMNGACNDETKREKITDKNYLDHALKNGQLFISTLHTDGYFYQGTYTASNHVVEVTDENAIAMAEAEYNVTKSKLNSKEESLEIKMKNIDMELSALTTEFDTVKNLISKNVEKVFTMFSS